jgi:hypothetical protein
MPAGVVPHGQVNIDETSYQDGTGDAFEYAAKQAMMGASGMPVGVQIVGWPGKDEMVLRVMREIQDKSKFKLPLQFVL